MSSLEKLKNLAKTNSLKEEPPVEAEIRSLIDSGRARLVDSRNPKLSLESRFDLAYNATHAFATAALRKQGFRASNRLIAFQCLEHTSALTKTQIRILVEAHGKRNQTEYDGDVNLNEKLVAGVIETAQVLLDQL